jgi:hypothetical protein
VSREDTASVQPIELHHHAAEDLRFIRRAMEGSTRFTAVSGNGEIAVGIVALLAAWLAARSRTPAEWLAVWLAAATVAFAVSLAAAGRKARRTQAPVLSLPARRFLFALIPALLAGAVLTPALYRAGGIAILPSMWLLLYGAGVVAAGAHSIPVVPVMGAAFMTAGALSLLAPSGAQDVVMAIGFGGLHLAFGAIIGWRHGG